MHCQHSLVAQRRNYFLILLYNKMDNLVKRIVQKELENHGKSPEKKERQADSRLGKLLASGKDTQKRGINDTIKNEKRVHIKWKRRNPIKQMDTTVSLENGGGHRFFICSEEDTIAFIKQKATELYFPNGKNKYGEEVQNKMQEECW